MSKLAWFLLAAALMGLGLFLVAVVGANAIGTGIALLGLFALIPGGFAAYGGGGDGGE
jgi:hypothetical protein